jgi:GMP synthase (glutamine-hydrolysing)
MFCIDLRISETLSWICVLITLNKKEKTSEEAVAKRIILIRHGDDPPDDRAYTYFQQNGFDVEITRPYKGDVLGDLSDDVVGTVIYGGPFNVFETDKHPFLNDEHRWIELCIENQVPMLGICQGAQSIAHTLGAKVGPREGEPHEFGYYQLYPTEAGADILSQPIAVTQAHFHEFEVPDGGELLAYSDTFPQQAFRYGSSTYGFQFHPEVTIEGFRRWQTLLSFNYGRPGVQTVDEQNSLMYEHDEAQAEWFYEFLDKLFGKPTD